MHDNEISHLWKKEKFTIINEKIFRQINSLVIYSYYSVKALISRNFSEKSARKNFRIFHTFFVKLTFLIKAKVDFTKIFRA